MKFPYSWALTRLWEHKMHRKSPENSRQVSRQGLTRYPVAMAVIAAIGGAIPSSAHADVRVTAQANSIRLETQDAALSEVLTALGVTYKLPNGGMPEPSRSLNGTYTGTARDVIFRVLDGYDFIVNRSDGRFDVVIYGVSGKTSNAAAAVATAPAVPPDSVTGKTPAPVATAAAQKSSTKGSMAGITGGGSSKSANPTSRTSVPDLLGTAALSQTQVAGAPKDTPTPKADMAALTQSAVISLKGLVASLKTTSIK
jgi:hypothetical protein